MEYFAYILLAIAILLVMVLIHESGHYTAAKLLGFTVEEFSIGFGPRLLGKRRKNGEMFSLRAFPLGGYCAFLGETDDEQPPVYSDGQKFDENNAENKTDISADKAAVAPSDVNAPAGGSNAAFGSADAAETGAQRSDSISDPDTQGDDEDLLSYVMRAEIKESEKSERAEKTEAAPIRLDKHGKPALTFNQQKPWKRIIVLFGGVLFNFLSAIIFAFIYIWAVGYSVPEVHEVNAVDCGLQKGDIILAVDGRDISVMHAFSEYSESVKEGQTVTFKVDRGGKIIDVEATKKKIEYTGADGKLVSYVGFGFVSQTAFTGNDVGTAFKYCVPYTFKLSWSIIGSFGQLITGKVPITSVTGPVGSVKLMADVTSANWRNILILLPLLASNLAIFNLLPFPALDGAQIIFTVIEWIRKKPIKRKIQSTINGIGLAVLLLFVVIVDILSFAL